MAINKIHSPSLLWTRAESRLQHRDNIALVPRGSWILWRIRIMSKKLDTSYKQSRAFKLLTSGCLPLCDVHSALVVNNTGAVFDDLSKYWTNQNNGFCAFPVGSAHMRWLTGVCMSSSRYIELEIEIRDTIFHFHDNNPWFERLKRWRWKRYDLLSH